MLFDFFVFHNSSLRNYGKIIQLIITLQSQNKQDKATADFARTHTKKYVTEQKRKVNAVLRSFEEAKNKSECTCTRFMLFN